MDICQEIEINTSSFLNKMFRAKAFRWNIDFLTMFLVLFPPFWKYFPIAFLKFMMPLPSKIKMEIGKEIISSEKSVDELYDEIQHYMQANMDKLASERVCPWF